MAKTTLHGVYRWCLVHMYNQCRDRVQRLSRDFLTDARLTRYFEAIHDSGAPVLYCWGFIDGACDGVSHCVH